MSKRKAHIVDLDIIPWEKETDKQYAERTGKLQFTNDCDPDLTICELQHENDRLVKEIKELSKRLKEAEEILHHIDEESNPAYLKTMKDDYFEVEKPFHNEGGTLF